MGETWERPPDEASLDERGTAQVEYLSPGALLSQQIRQQAAEKAQSSPDGRPPAETPPTGADRGPLPPVDEEKDAEPRDSAGDGEDASVSSAGEDDPPPPVDEEEEAEESGDESSANSADDAGDASVSSAEEQESTEEVEECGLTNSAGSDDCQDLPRIHP